MALEPTRFGMQPHKFNGAFTAPLPLRSHSFLRDPRTASAIRDGVIDVAVGGSASGGASIPKVRACVFARTCGSVKLGWHRAVPSFHREEDSLRCVPSVGCWQGATNEAVLRFLEPWREARVLRLSDAKGAFSGWESNHLQARPHVGVLLMGVVVVGWCHSNSVIVIEASPTRRALRSSSTVRLMCIPAVVAPSAGAALFDDDGLLPVARRVVLLEPRQRQ